MIPGTDVMQGSVFGRFQLILIKTINRSQLILNNIAQLSDANEGLQIPDVCTKTRKSFWTLLKFKWIRVVFCKKDC